MPFHKDEGYAAEVGTAYGEYLVTYKSPRGQVRADLFRKPDGRVEAHVSFPGGIFASGVTEPYVTDLWRYAEENGFADRFKLIMS
jgi:hypothetical protein